MGHGLSGSRAYRAWKNMRQRCENPRATGYANYGGRGVVVCERWRNFESFHADMGDPPDGLSLDRVDVNGNYEPGNCRWATATQQIHNQRVERRKMGKKTSVYLDDDLQAAVEASPDGLAVIIRRGLGLEALSERRIAAEAAETVRANLNEDMREIVRDEVREALRSMRGDY